MAKDETKKDETKKPNRPAPTSPDYVRFVCDTAIASPEHEYSRQFGRGAIADLSEEIWPGDYLVYEVRPGTFERIDAAAAEPTPAQEIEIQVDDDSEE